MVGPFSRSLSILIYHRVLSARDDLQPEIVCARDFELQLGVLRRWYKVMPLHEAVTRLRDGTLPFRAACVTFDDGYADNVSVALPLLQRHGVPATFFISTGFLDGGMMFNDMVIEAVRAARGTMLDARAAGMGMLPVGSNEERRRAIAELLGALKYLPQEERQRRVDILAAAVGRKLAADLMMTTDQVRHLHRSGMELGAHTSTHPILAKLTLDQARSEIRSSRERLEEISGSTVRMFAYPNGKPGMDYTRDHVAIVNELGFEAALSTAWGVATARTDRYQLPRFTPWDRTPGKFLARLIQNTFRTQAEMA